ncbi:hypothetical protein pb186bvf_016629 [Paramecium bursaria]
MQASFLFLFAFKFQTQFIILLQLTNNNKELHDIIEQLERTIKSFFLNQIESQSLIQEIYRFGKFLFAVPYENIKKISQARNKKILLKLSEECSLKCMIKNLIKNIKIYEKE